MSTSDLHQNRTNHYQTAASLVARHWIARNLIAMHRTSNSQIATNLFDVPSRTATNLIAPSQ